MTTTKQSSSSTNQVPLSTQSKAGGGDYFPQSAIGAAMQFLLLTQDSQNKMSKELAKSEIDFSEQYGSDGHTKKCIGSDKEGKPIYATIPKGLISMLQDCFKNEATDISNQSSAQAIKYFVQGGTTLGTMGVSALHDAKTDNSKSINAEKGKIGAIKTKLEAPYSGTKAVKPESDAEDSAGQNENLPAQERSELENSAKQQNRLKELKAKPEKALEFKLGTKENPTEDDTTIELLKTEGHEKLLKKVKEKLDDKLKSLDGQMNDIASQQHTRAQKYNMFNTALSSGADGAASFVNASYASDAKRDEGTTAAARSTQQAQLEYLKGLDNNSQQAHQNANNINDILVSIGRNSSAGAA